MKPSDFQGRRILITGNTGFKGAWLSEWLMDWGAEVAGFSIGIPSEPSLFQILGHEKRLARHTWGDVRHPDALTQAMAEFKPEMVFHLAAQSLVRASYETPRETFETNVMGTVNVFEAVRRISSVRVLVNVTSDKCYENLEVSRGYVESDRLGGKDPYSASKGAAEIVFGAYGRSFFSEAGTATCVSVRAGNVIGGGDWAADRIIPDCARSWERGAAVKIRSPRSIRPWQHVLEPLSGYLTVAALAARGDGPLRNEGFNFGPGDDATQTVEALLSTLQKFWANARWEVDPAGQGAKKEAGILMLDCSKALDRLHWQPALRFEEGVKLTAEWYREWAQGAGADTLYQLTRSQLKAYLALRQHA